MRDPRRRPHARDESGFSLIEVMVAGIVAVIAVLGLAYTFSTGRGMIDRFAAARAALAAAEERLETLAAQVAADPSTPDLDWGIHPASSPLPRRLNRNLSGLESWTVAPVDDPADNGGGDPDPQDYRRVTVEIRWSQGAVIDRVTLTRVFLNP